ncbi:hypothetical protein [Massilia aerilata]|uniref:Lipoprotein n=1 Tax=Massilia aerilata TaxID=453817 RepID=A0ABW0S1I0_9BURK
MKVLSATAASVIGFALMASCGKTEQNTTTTVQSTSPAMPAKTQPETEVARNLGYYEAHLDEAKKTWDECQKLSPEAITELVRTDCSLAQTAWSTQPYKPTPSTFSSRGGRH